MGTAETRKPAHVSRHPRGWLLVLPSESLRELVKRRLLSKYSRFDYVTTFRDVNGAGMQLGIGPEGPPRPLSSPLYYRAAASLYKNPGYDLVNL